MRYFLIVLIVTGVFALLFEMPKVTVVARDHAVLSSGRMVQAELDSPQAVVRCEQGTRTCSSWYELRTVTETGSWADDRIWRVNTASCRLDFKPHIYFDKPNVIVLNVEREHPVIPQCVSDMTVWLSAMGALVVAGALSALWWTFKYGWE